MAGYKYSSSGNMSPTTSRRFSTDTQSSGSYGSSYGDDNNLRNSGYSSGGQYTWGTGGNTSGGKYSASNMLPASGGGIGSINLGRATDTAGIGYNSQYDQSLNRNTSGSNSGSNAGVQAGSAFYSAPSSALAGLATVSRQRAMDRAATDIGSQQKSALDAAARRSAGMGKKFAYSPNAMVQSAANTAAAMTRAGDQADTETYNRQNALAQMRQGENAFTESNRRFPIQFNESQRQFNLQNQNAITGLGIQQQQANQGATQIGNQSGQFYDTMNAANQRSINARKAYDEAIGNDRYGRTNSLYNSGLFDQNIYNNSTSRRGTGNPSSGSSALSFGRGGYDPNEFNSGN